MNFDSILSLQHIFSMLTPTNSFATLHLFSVSVKRELAIPFSLCASLFCAFHFMALFWRGGVESRNWGMFSGPGHTPREATSLAGDADHNRFESQHGRAEACGWIPDVKLIVFFFSLILKFTFTFSRCFYPKRLTVHSGYTFY